MYPDKLKLNVPKMFFYNLMTSWKLLAMLKQIAMTIPPGLASTWILILTSKVIFVHSTCPRQTSKI